MRFNIYYFFGQYIIFFLGNRDTYLIVKALIGENVERVESDEFNSIVSIRKIKDGDLSPEQNHVCTGTIISKQDVLTAEHCFKYLEEEGTELVIGSFNLSNGLIYYPYWWLTYNDWSSRNAIKRRFLHNDIAIIRLFEEIPDDIKPSLLSNRTYLQLYGMNVVIAGWGKSNNGRIPTIMEKAVLTIISNSNCQNKIKELRKQYFHLHERIFCTFAAPYILLQHGDSGGPVFYMNEIVGINVQTCQLREAIPNEYKVNVHLGVNYYKFFIHDLIYNY